MPRPVRVCFVIDRLSRAGTETQLLALIRSFDRSRVEPHLCLLDGTDELSRTLSPGDCPVLRLGVRTLAGPAAVAQGLWLANYLRRHRIDVVQTYFLDSTYFGVPVAKLGGVRRVVRVRNNLGYWLTPAHRWLGRLYGRLVDRTLTNSDQGRDALLQSDHLRPNTVDVLENGVDVDRFAGFPPPDTSRPVVRIGAVANLRPVKGLDVLVAAATRMRPTVRFEVAGDGPQRPELERLIAGAGLGERFRLLGAVADVPAFLATLDIAVLPSRSEGMSNALLESMAAGRAIVATRVGANPRLLGDGEFGLLVEPEDPAALASAIERLLDDPILAARLGAAARKRAVAEFSRDTMRRRFEAYYHRLRAA